LKNDNKATGMTQEKKIEERKNHFVEHNTRAIWLTGGDYAHE